MDTVLGILGIIVYAAAVIALASGVTWLVVKVSPAEKPKVTPTEPDPAA